MAEPIRSFDDAVAYALTLPDTELSTSYGKPAVKTASNGRAFLYSGHESETSFGIAIDMDTIEMLKETDPDRVRATIERSRDWSAAKARAKTRKKK